MRAIAVLLGVVATLAGSACSRPAEPDPVNKPSTQPSAVASAPPSASGVTPSGDRDPYAVLGVPRTASQQEIAAAFRSQSAHWHPDRHPGDPAAAQRFRLVAAAYYVLSDPGRRGRYDTTGEVEPGSPFAAPSK